MMQKNNIINQSCIVRDNHECKRIFEGSKICFISSPSGDETIFELKIIQAKLMDADIEPYIAADKRVFQKDIFCQKICSKIIESKFCIVILNDVVDKEDRIRKSVPNVHYEYGLMTAFRKKIIPIQLNEQRLPFNIQDLDTLKYTRADFETEIECAIFELLSSEEKQSENVSASSSNLEWVLDVMGLVKIDYRIDYKYFESLQSNSLGFSIYNNPKDGHVYFVSIFKNDYPERKIAMESKILTLKIKNHSDDLSCQIKEINKELSEGTRKGFIEDRISDRENVKKKLKKSHILILTEKNQDIETIKSEYRELCKNIEFVLDIEVINNQIAERMLTD